MITLEDYVVNRLERLETATAQFEILNKDLNSENIRLRGLLAAIGNYLTLSASGNAIWMDSIYERESMYNQIIEYFNLREKWEAERENKEDC